MSAENNFRIEIIEKPSTLPPEKCVQLIEDFVRLAYQTTGGDQWEKYEPAIKGWREYYTAAGARPQDYDRLLLIYDGSVLVHFTGLILFDHASCRFVYIRTAMTLKQYHGAGLLRTAILALLSKEWLRSLGEAYLVLRTANPIVYEATTHIVNAYLADSTLSFACYPKINSEAELDPVPPHIQALAAAVAEKTSPEAVFIPRTFINKGYFKMYGALYKDSAFPCRNPATLRFFQKHVDYSNQDGILMLIHMRPETGGRELNHG